MPTKKVADKIAVKSEKVGDKYFEAIGKRKTARARVRLVPASKTSFDVNGKTLDQYFPTLELQGVAKTALAHTGEQKYKVTVRASGGGIHGQAEAMRLGIARALLLATPDIKTELRKNKLLTRDGRIKARRKFGLKKARKSPQWSKR